MPVGHYSNANRYQVGLTVLLCCACTGDVEQLYNPSLCDVYS